MTIRQCSRRPHKLSIETNYLRSSAHTEPVLTGDKPLNRDQRFEDLANAVAQVQQQGNEKGQTEEAAKEQEVAMGPIYKLDTLIVNLADQGGKRYLRITMDLELKPAENIDAKEVIDEMDKRLPQIRDTILMILPTKQYARNCHAADSP